MKKVISFSLWGDDEKYTIGAIRNAQLASQVYPEWEARFYCGTSVPVSIIDQLRELQAHVIMMEEAGDWTGMFWRFLAIADSDVEIMISRDTDSRLNTREKAAVDEWLEGPQLFHIMRDHPWHNAPILGGMWGARKPLLQDMAQLIAEYQKGDFWQVDQNFLREVVAPRVEHTLHIHDEFFSRSPFPTARNGDEFVGQVFDESEQTIQEHIEILRRYL